MIQASTTQLLMVENALRQRQEMGRRQPPVKWKHLKEGTINWKFNVLLGIIEL